ncbi:hypothetical protein GLOIN_2v1514163, partial [Rhizophagus irregularis DAOM 181602=DAOM 197198]
TEDAYANQLCFPTSKSITKIKSTLTNRYKVMSPLVPKITSRACKMVLVMF